MPFSSDVVFSIRYIITQRGRVYNVSPPAEVESDLKLLVSHIIFKPCGGVYEILNPFMRRSIIVRSLAFSRPCGGKVPA